MSTIMSADRSQWLLLLSVLRGDSVVVDSLNIVATIACGDLCLVLVVWCSA